MKRLILISIVSLSLLLSSCTSCNPFGKGGDESSEETTIIEESSTITTENSQNSSHQQDESDHHSSRTTEQLGDKKNENSGTLTGKEESSQESSKPEESSSKPESSKPEESSSKPEESSSESSEESSEESTGPTDGQKKALAKAQEYLDIGNGYSYKNIVDMLDSDGFDHADVLWAAENCGADWKEQAKIRAANMLYLGPMSKSMVTDELKNFVEFTKEEAEYGAENCGADWGEQAKLYAQWMVRVKTYSEKTLRKEMEDDCKFAIDDINAAMTQFTEDDWKAEAVEQGEQSAVEIFYVGIPRSDMVAEIESYGFTTSQAEYGADNCGIDWLLNEANAYLNDNQPVSPNELSDYLYYTLGYSKEEILDILDYYTQDGGGVWYYQAGQYAEYLQGSVMTVADMMNALEGGGFTHDQAWQATYNNGGFGGEELAYYRVWEIMNDDSVPYENKTKPKITDMLVTEGFSWADADAATTSFGLTDTPPKG